MSLLELTGICKTYRLGVRAKRVTAVRDLSFVLGEDCGITGFVGPNGAGKTTTIKMAVGLVRPTRGRIAVLGAEAADPSCRRRIAFVSEQPYFYTHLTIAESLRFIGQLRGLTRATLAGEIARVLEIVGLAEHAAKKVRELSKGMQQRLNMAQALMGDPEFYIFDEPMSGMDPPGRSLFRRIFRDLKAAGKAVFFSTHILEDVETLCARVIVLSRGRLRYDGRVDDLLEKGFEGTELTVASLPGEIRQALESSGCEVTMMPTGAMQVLVPVGGDPKAAQARLSSSGIYCESIAQRRKSLETLLYAEQEDAHAG